jgi:hypothetical protein
LINSRLLDGPNDGVCLQHQEFLFEIFAVFLFSLRRDFSSTFFWTFSLMRQAPMCFATPRHLWRIDPPPLVSRPHGRLLFAGHGVADLLLMLPFVPGELCLFLLVVAGLLAWRYGSGPPLHEGLFLVLPAKRICPKGPTTSSSVRPWCIHVLHDMGPCRGPLAGSPRL